MKTWEKIRGIDVKERSPGRDCSVDRLNRNEMEGDNDNNQEHDSTTTEHFLIKKRWRGNWHLDGYL